ncbi:MAG: hypothetical protein AAGA43_13590 [Bacteroidota bacterium]
MSNKLPEPIIQPSIWEDIIFNRELDSVGDQRILAKASVDNYGEFRHKNGYMVSWTKLKFDSDFLPIHIKNKFFSPDLNRLYPD